VGGPDKLFGANVRRDDVKGSPIVPGSAKRIIEEGEFVLYGVSMLRGHYAAGRYVEGDIFEPGTLVDYVEPAKAAFREEKKYMVREFSYDPSKAGDVESSIESSKAELNQIRQRAIFWCKGHFGEVYHCWMHLKVIRAFAESVLRYGLPVNFTSFFLSSNPKREATATKQLTQAIVQARPELKQKCHYLLEDGGDEMDKLPYVCQKFTVIGAAN
jgi:V-type H+-transporting ATPase subunit C